MTIQTSSIDYLCGDATHEAFIAWDDANTAPAPGVLVSHAWGGRTEFEEGKARWLAGQGYVGLPSTCTAKVFAAAAPKKMRR
jgi:dienelactone hydrolase